MGPASLDNNNDIHAVYNKSYPDTSGNQHAKSKYDSNVHITNE